MRDHLLLFINGEQREVRGGDAFLSVSDYLRLRCGLVGTKIVCSEGDCGACTTLIGRPAANRQQLDYKPVDSCIQFMFQLDGTHIVTVEGLRRDGTLNAVQQAMVDCHGSQCGFCTPGFVMAMTGLLEQQKALDEPTLRSELTGNLCRCTGYTPIIDSGLKCNGADHDRLAQLYPAAPMLGAFASTGDDELRLETTSFGVQHVACSPRTLEEALDFLAMQPTATIVAGATDIGVRANKAHRLPPVILDLNRIAELEAIAVGDGVFRCGARASWTTLLAAFRQAAPAFARILQLFGAPQIRHVGTIAGNIANASPIADSLPFLLVMEAVLVLASKSGRREVNINQFYHGYKKLELKPGELITEVRIPLPAESELLQLYKVSRRRDLDISGFTAAVRMQLDGDAIKQASIAFGAVGPTVMRARQTERFLVGEPLTLETMQTAGDIAVNEVTPIDDVRGSAEYRRQLTRNVLLKFYYQTQSQLAAV
ncbi:xanthine dehydrogenase small subunit [Lacipirellula parvula]|uniref:Xanthine dehydrogenase iron-sulfur subunit n=1 Tax=Lacipirellula parvula TaxID=2650471 RepID=A0A5K7XID8_9BACT|nr:FAD binding domain-containing protein [Lacipirellula parvula]BBO32709.1 xanthine dehydrogenase iron-sulfur subunit [Lacipirellula parvula]